MRGAKGSHHIFTHPGKPGTSACLIPSRIWGWAWCTSCLNKLD
ncbi:MAG: type II toxin-antitoxin system HicA family toxin [Rhodocyclaceae bacterium]|nr:type II toxin-antitoxin system HicA family toxin [Rhodocyclaceae bacterium]